jgi:dienelactone hydrolase
MFKPAAAGPFPAIVILPTCGGHGRPHSFDWAKAALERGYAVLVVDPLSFSASATLYAQTLNGDEIKAAVSGKSGTWQGMTGNSGSVRYSADGKSRVTGKFKGFTEDTGIWRISSNKVLQQVEENSRRQGSVLSI